MGHPAPEDTGIGGREVRQETTSNVRMGSDIDMVTEEVHWIQLENRNGQIHICTFIRDRLPPLKIGVNKPSQIRG